MMPTLRPAVFKEDLLVWYLEPQGSLVSIPLLVGKIPMIAT